MQVKSYPQLQPECLWRDGEQEPEEDPEEWVDRVADEVEEKRSQKMQALEKPEGSAELHERKVAQICTKGILVMAIQSRGGREGQDQLQENLLSLRGREMTFCAH